MAEGDHLVQFVAIMRRLRAECPWKSAQTHRSLARYLLEETHETLEAIDTGDPEHLREELGDLLLQVYFHSEIASLAGQFTIDDVAAGLTEKMVRRNGHVFAGGESDLSPEEINDRWQQAKALEKDRSSVTEGLPPGLPALLYADKVLDRLARASTTVTATPLPQTPQTPQTPGTTATSDEVGERLLDLVREARASGVDPEQALRDAVRRTVDAAQEAQR